VLTIAVTIKLIAEVALLALSGQCLLGLVVTGTRRPHNFFYQVLRIAGAPFIRFTRRVCPAFVDDRAVPWITLLMLALAWLGATFLKIHACLQIGLHLCK
jgi:hypothetical protein